MYGRVVWYDKKYIRGAPEQHNHMRGDYNTGREILKPLLLKKGA